MVTFENNGNGMMTQGRFDKGREDEKIKEQREKHRSAQTKFFDILILFEGEYIDSRSTLSKDGTNRDT